MCAEGRPESNDLGRRFFQGTYCDAYLLRDKLTPGYSVVVWRGRHVAEPTELSDAEATAYWMEVLTAARILEQQYQPVKTNYATNSNGVPHLHTQIVLRFLEDPAPGRPLPWPDSLQPIAEDEFERQVAALRALGDSS